MGQLIFEGNQRDAYPARRVAQAGRSAPGDVTHANICTILLSIKGVILDAIRHS